MELHRVLTTRTIFWRRPWTHDHRTIRPELVHVSGSGPLNTATTSIADRVLMTEQTHTAKLDRPIVPGAELSGCRLKLREVSCADCAGGIDMPPIRRL